MQDNEAIEFNTMNELIYKHFIQSSSYSVESGAKWYEIANDHAKRLSTKYDVPTYKVAAIISALSPRNKWERNVVDAENILKHGNDATVSTFNNNKLKALKILTMTSENDVRNLFTKSLKTLSFYDNILNYRTSQRVTIDIWALRSVNYTKILTPKRYKLIESAYLNCSSELGLLPNQLQAIIWQNVRGSNNGK